MAVKDIELLFTTPLVFINTLVAVQSSHFG